MEKPTPFEKTSDLLRRGEFEAAWQRHCSFLDLDLNGFMARQWTLLEDHLALARQSPLWQRLFGERLQGLTPQNFRERLPLTTYDQYRPHLQDRPSDILAVPIKAWARTSGLSGKPKWVPYTEGMYRQLGLAGVTAGILSAATKRGEIRLRPGDVVASNLPPRPFISGLTLMATSEVFDYRFLPPLDETEELDFPTRTRRVFQLALREGMDFLGAMTLVLVRMGEAFEQGHREQGFSLSLLHPKVLLRLWRAYRRARREGRSHLLPKDVWQLKGLQCGGVDTEVFREAIRHYWGVDPFNVYGATEVGVLAMQAWDHGDLYFLPDSAFYEFIPYEDWLREQREQVPPVRTVLMDEVQPGQRYEVVITNFYGGALARYRMHDLVEVTGIGDEATGIRLPRFRFVGRTGSFIHFPAFPGLIDEGVLLRAFAQVGFRYTDWVVRKEFDGDRPYLHFYVEPKPTETMPAEDLARGLHEALKVLLPDYHFVETVLDYLPIRVTYLAHGVFEQYVAYRLKQGADLAHLKPARIEPSLEALQLLLHQHHVLQAAVGGGQ